MKVLLVIENFKLGGKQRRFIELLKGLNKIDEIDYHVLILSNEIYYNEIHSIASDITILQRKKKKDPALFNDIKNVVMELQPDIVHTWGSMSSVYVLPSIWFTKAKLINSMITNATKLNVVHEDWIRSKLTFPFSHVIIANSYAGLKAFNVVKKGAVIHNGIDFGRIRELEDEEVMKAKFKIVTPKVVGMVGAFEQRKDYDLYISAAISLTQSRQDVTFLAVGQGRNLERIRSMVPDNLSDKIIFTGPQKNVESLINVFDIGVLTTNNKVHGEGISNSILEYMALSKPVIATRGGGTSEIVTDQETGYLVEPSKLDELIGKIRHLLDNSNLSSTFGSNGKKRVMEHFNLQKMTSRYVDIYQSLKK